MLHAQYQGSKDNADPKATAVGTLRMRLQLCPDPPFFALCTMTLLGQPRIDISCMPLTKKLNVMDLPFVSSFIGSSIDAALSSLVAPKSLTLDLKDMLVGDDFKKDTSHRGVLIVRIKQGRDFKAGDPGLGPLKKGSSDAYVAVGTSYRPILLHYCPGSLRLHSLKGS